jgi:hypothetical protein
VYRVGFFRCKTLWTTTSLDPIYIFVVHIYCFLYTRINFSRKLSIFHSILFPSFHRKIDIQKYFTHKDWMEMIKANFQHFSIQKHTKGFEFNNKKFFCYIFWIWLKKRESFMNGKSHRKCLFFSKNVVIKEICGGARFKFSIFLFLVKYSQVPGWSKFAW